MDDLIGWGIFFGIGLVIWLISYINGLYNTNERQSGIIASQAERLNNLEYELSAHEALEARYDAFDELFEERAKYFPTVGVAWSEYERAKGEIESLGLTRKKHPAYSAAQKVKEISQEKRALQRELVEWKYKALAYEGLYPWIEEDVGAELEADIESRAIEELSDKDTKEDPVRELVSDAQYRSLSPVERNQLALDRYLTKRNQSKWMIGKMYERYVGYLYEKEGWQVQYFGIEKRFEDLGRDLIARKGKEIHVVQCKNWSVKKQIYENSIFQLFGTYFTYASEHEKFKVTPVFYTSTNLSETAKEFSKRLDIEVHENVSLDKNYPIIKCNISSSGEKIYHLPFDQQYDRTIIEPKKGEFYATNCQEAEAHGYRRAFRHAYSN